MTSSIKKAIDKIVEDYKTGVLFGDMRTIEEHTSHRTGYPGFDYALDPVGIGLPPGRFAEFFGPEKAGKSTLAIQLLAEGQRLGHPVAYIDVEHRIDLPYLEALGLEDNDRRIFIRPGSGEEVFDIIGRLVRVGVQRIAVDSIAALVATAEMENEKGPAGQNRLGLQAAMLSQGCRVLTPIISKTGAIIIFTNQIRDRIGGYGNPEKTTGGKAILHYASTRIRISRSGKPEEWGHMVRCHIVKNSVYRPFTEWFGRLEYGKGFDRVFDLLKVATDIGLVAKKGSWYYHKGLKMGCGFEKTRDFLVDDPEAYSLIVKDVDEAVLVK